MHTFIHILYFLLLLICIAWNAYNTHQHYLLAERQGKLEKRLGLLPERRFGESPLSDGRRHRPQVTFGIRINGSTEQLSQVSVKRFRN